MDRENWCKTLDKRSNVYSVLWYTSDSLKASVTPILAEDEKQAEAFARRNYGDDIIIKKIMPDYSVK